MKTHRNARLTLMRRAELASSVVHGGLSAVAAAQAHGVSVTTARKWIRRYLIEGSVGLTDRSSRPRRIPRTTGQEQKMRILALRRMASPLAAIASEVGVSVATVSRICAARGQSEFYKSADGSDAGTDTALTSDCTATPPRHLPRQ